MIRALPHPAEAGRKCYRIAVLNAGALAPGMNTTARAAIRFGLDQGHSMIGVRNSFEGLANGEIEELNWMSVSGWAYVRAEGEMAPPIKRGSIPSTV